MSETAREVIARAVLEANVCERAFCDDARADHGIRCETCDCKNAAMLIVEALDASGFVIAPKEPTAAMQKAAWDKHCDFRRMVSSEESIAVYAAMIAAAAQESKP